jgi:RNA recognition motif-containing protein
MDGYRIFVGGLSLDTTDDELSDYFKKYGTITDYVVICDKVTGASRGFGFVTFEQLGIVDKIVSEEHEIRGKRLNVKKAEPKDSEVAARRHDRGDRGDHRDYRDRGGDRGERGRGRSRSRSRSRDRHDRRGGSSSAGGRGKSSFLGLFPVLLHSFSLLFLNLCQVVEEGVDTTSEEEEAIITLVNQQ